MNVPQLRFSGFDGEWENFELKKLVKLEGGATPLKSEKRYWQDGHIPWVSSQEVGPKKLDKTTFNITEAAVSETSTKMVDKDTLLLVVRSGILIRKIPLSITTVPMAINQDIKAMIIKDKKLHHLFLYQWMKKNEKTMLSNVVKGGTTVQSVNTPDLQDYLIGIPSIQEQNKIAYFFELIDGKVEKQQEKIEKLEQFKKGMMQKIFSQELRFKAEDGGEFPEWEEKKLGQVLKIKHGRDQKKIETPDGKFPILATGGTIGRTDTFIYDKESVLIGRKGTIDRPVYMDTPFWTVDTLFYSEIKENNYPKFIFYIFQNINWKLYNEASGVPSLSAKTIEAIKITAPTYEEQKVIADYLSVIDSKIKKEKEKLMVLEEQKRGFMQGMFA